MSGNGASGAGVEREAIYAAYNTFMNEMTTWLMVRREEYHTIATSVPLEYSHLVPLRRKENFMALGALTALLLIHGIAPPHLSPLLLQYIIHDCTFNSIHPTFVCEWDPDLHRRLLEWKQLGPAGDIRGFADIFATYFDLQVGCSPTSCAQITLTFSTKGYMLSGPHP